MTDPLTATQPSLSSIVRRLVAIVSSGGFGAGDRAALRRWAPGQPIPLAFYRLWLRHDAGELPPEPQGDAWMAIAWSTATLGGGYSPRSLGQALAESGFSEGRLERLLSAPVDVRLDLYMSAVRFLAAKKEAFDLSEAALFLLTADGSKREGVNRRIAQAYYRHIPKTA